MSNHHIPHKEPEEVFSPLSSIRYAEFYALEMNNYSRDICFYQNNISEDSKVLELGCGSGRICRSLAKTGIKATGLDLSPEMLRLAMDQENSDVCYVCMDMCQMAFTCTFDHIIIPYNTLNLLKTESQILQCLQQVHHLLKPAGTLLFQVYLPGSYLFDKKLKKLFQFQIINLPDNSGKLIKESIRSFVPSSDIFTLEERYRVRKNTPGSIKKDYNHIFHLAGFTLEKWIDLLKFSQFTINKLYGDCGKRPFNKGNDSLLLAIISKQSNY